MCHIVHRKWKDVWNSDSFSALSLARRVEGTRLFEIARRWGDHVGAICDVVHLEADEAVYVFLV